MVAKELEPDLQKDMITWGSSVNMISHPCFITTKTVPTKPHPTSETDGPSHRSARKSKKKVKTISTQTESPATSRPGVRYMERSPSQELVDSFSSLSSVDHSPVPPTIKSITMETTKHNLMRSKGTSPNKCHKKKRKHVTSTTAHVASDISATTQDITQDTTTTTTTQDNHPSSKECYHFTVNHESYINTPISQKGVPLEPIHHSFLTSEAHSTTTDPIIPAQASYTSTPVKSNDALLSREVSSQSVVTEAGYTSTQPSYDSTPVQYDFPQCSILTRELSSLRQPVITLPNSQIRQDVARWSKFEQLKAKYLTPVSLQSKLLKHNLT